MENQNYGSIIINFNSEKLNSSEIKFYNRQFKISKELEQKLSEEIHNIIQFGESLKKRSSEKKY